MERERFSKFGALVVIAGSAVGLGNIWRFPYMVATNGGAAFILIYILFVLAICLPVMIAELTIGRRSHANAFRAMETLSPTPTTKKVFKGFGILNILIPTLVLSYYCVIGGSTVDYFFKSLGITTPGTPLWDVIWTVIFLVLTAAIVMSGVKGGIERFSMIMMPLLFVIVVLIAIRSMTLTTQETAYTAKDGIIFLFRPDFSKVTVKTCIAALGQAFFSLSIGAGAIMTYGSYVNPKDNLGKTAGEIAFFDLLFALIAGCAVIPAVFALKEDPMAVLANNTDSKLVFNILPEIFPVMPMGDFVGSIFFFGLIIAAITSSISQYEAPVTYLTEEHKLSRPVAVIIVFAIAVTIGTLCALRGQLLGILDGICANWLMPMAGVVIVVFVGWIMKRDELQDELSSHGMHNVPRWFMSSLHFLIRYIAPIGVLAVFLSQIFKF